MAATRESRKETTTKRGRTTGVVRNLRAALDTMVRGRQREILRTHEEVRRVLAPAAQIEPPPVPRLDLPGVEPLRTVCAWCGVVVTDGPADHGESHTICQPCFDWTLARRTDQDERDYSTHLAHLRLPPGYFGDDE